MDELELDLEEGQTINKTEQRIKSLSSKVAETAQERDEANAKAEAETTARVAAEKRVDFLNAFTDVSSKYQGATEYKTQIEDKVLAGYSVEDATVSVLNAEGKLVPQAPQPIPQAPVAGGSAITPPLQSGNKTLGEMTRDEKRAALIEAEQRGDISLT